MSIKKIQFSPIKDRPTVCDEDQDPDDQPEDVVCRNTDLTVKFEVSEAQFIAHSYKRTSLLREIRLDIAAKFKVPESRLELLHKASLVNEAKQLIDLPRNQFGIVELQLRLKEAEDKLQLDLNVYYSNFTLPEIITVNVPSDSPELEDRQILVEIDNRQIVKPFLGGYRDPVTRVEYHNASTQTGPMKKYRNVILSRETQTEPHLVKSLRTTRTPRNEIREFVTSDDMLGRLEKWKSARVIQKCYRAYRWRKLIRDSANQWRSIQEKAREKANYETVNADYNRVLRLLFMDPKEKQDFDQIHSAIQHWKQEEKKRLRSLHGVGSYIAELNLVVEKEIFLLNEVDQKKTALKKANKEKTAEKLLHRLGQAKKFISKNNDTVLEIDTIQSQKIRFWTNLYSALKSPVIDKAKRLELLDNVLLHLKEEDYNQLKDLQSLFEQERDLWELNYTASAMIVLRERQILYLFDLIKSIDRKKKDRGGEEKQRICGKCKNLLPESRFVLLGRKNVPDVCKRCDALHTMNKDENVYQEILRTIRRDERKSGALASFAFIIQEKDIQYIVETIWHGHSILSQTTDRHRLRLPRYIASQDWAPWNCILLTETEAKAHLKIQDLRAVYQDHLLKVITGRNNLAHTTFRRLKRVNFEFVESGQWWTEDPQNE